ncbi:uncharacterized protein LOC108911644 isoform X1 [Anoplophora glabripennis]|uniref:uncharacterized protein LOC108911644 isoform X1 n=1 Tax=Anoplophora glabripennis TaxID=217634 RepID=UPI0008752909|nr:uncharacterized protein LOC108911644 isoform X1 [Anoplophora glabripennis]
MDQVSNVFNGFTNIMDQNIRGVQLGCYSVALVGLTVAMRKVRPFSKFKAPSDIPNHFVKERRELTGLVKRIEPDGALLMVQHKPLVNIPLIPSGQLPVKITGVNVTGLGISWLQTVVVGSEVKFVPILKGRNLVECEVLLVQPSKDKKKKPQLVNIGESLVRIGFGATENNEKALVEDRLRSHYYNQLRNAELYALRKRLGLRYYIKPTKKVLTTLGIYLYVLLGKTYQKISNLPYKLPKIYAS